jgi:hypothetical protein
MKSLTIGLNEVYTLNGNLNASHLEKEINEYFRKQNYTSRAKDFKPGSKAHQECLEQDAVVNAIPDHKVRDTHNKLTINCALREDVTFQILYITEEYHPEVWDDESEGYYTDYETTLERDIMFLRLNLQPGRWFGPRDFILTFEDLMKTLSESFVADQEWRDKQRYFDWFEEDKTKAPYKLIVEDIIRAKKELKEVNFYKGGSMLHHDEDKDYVMIGDEKIMKSDIRKAWDLYESKEPIYDEHDRRIEWPIIYSDGSGTTKWEFYKKQILQQTE